MSEWIVNAQIVSATLSSDNWVKVLWRTEIDGKEEWIPSNFGPDYGLREKFYDRTGVGSKSLSSVEGRVFRARIYENSKGKLHVSPAELSDPNKSFSASQPLTAPLGVMVGNVHVPPPNAPHEDFKKATEVAKTNPIDDLRAVVKTLQPTNPIPAPVSTPVPVVSAKSMAGYKGSDTKSLRNLDAILDDYLNKESTKSMESRLPKVVESVRGLQAEIAAVLKNRK